MLDCISIFCTVYGMLMIVYMQRLEITVLLQVLNPLLCEAFVSDPIVGHVC